MSLPLGESVQFVHRTVTGQDSYGNDVVTDSTVAVSNVGWDPGTSTEALNGQDQVVQMPRFFLPAGIAVDPLDAIVRANGNRYEVTGEPGDYVSPFTGWAPGVVVNVRRVTG